MILLLTIGGRTGNQLFQIGYAFSRRRTSEWLVSIGFAETRSLLGPSSRSRWLDIDASAFRFVIERCLFPLLYHGLIKTGIIDFHYQNGDEYTIHQGKIAIFRVFKGYFQSTVRQSQDLRSLMDLKSSLRCQARKVLASISFGRTPVFVHLRRTDKKTVFLEGREEQIPDRYYLEAIDSLSRSNSNLFYVIVGDDPDYATRLFQQVGPKYISRLSVQEDLALMSECHGGVLSNSTFAWWGAFFSNPTVGYIAPKYWIGWNIGRWVPSELRGNFVREYLDARGN